MAFVPRRAKKQRRTGFESDVVPFQWKMLHNGEEYSLFVHDEDIANRLIPVYVDDTDMAAFDPETMYYFLMRKAGETPDDEVQYGEAYRCESGALVITYDDFENYFLLYRGEHVAAETESFWAGDDLVFWFPSCEDYFYVRTHKGYENNEVFVPVKMDFSNGTLWFRESDNNFVFYINCENISEECTASYLDDDLLICHTPERKYYIFRGWEQADLYEPSEAEVLNENSPLLWAKTGNGKQYSFYIKGEKVAADEWKATFSDDDVIVFRPDTLDYYMLSGFKEAETGELFPPAQLHQGHEAIWERIGEKNFKLYVRGENISTEVEPKVMDGNLLLLDSASNTIYVCMQFYDQPYNVFQPAVMMDAREFV